MDVKQLEGGPTPRVTRSGWRRGANGSEKLMRSGVSAPPSGGARPAPIAATLLSPTAMRIRPVPSLDRSSGVLEARSTCFARKTSNLPQGGAGGRP